MSDLEELDKDALLEIIYSARFWRTYLRLMWARETTATRIDVEQAG